MVSQTNASREATVIGAGIVGICCALYLQRQGFSVTLVDRGGPGEGCSMGNAGVFGANSCVPLAMPGALRRLVGTLGSPSASLIRHLARFTPIRRDHPNLRVTASVRGEGDLLPSGDHHTW